MTRLLMLLRLIPFLAPVVGAIYTGFNYGAFWTNQANVKKVTDFRDGFSYAKNISSHVVFDSARLFTCKTHGTIDDPTGAFEAAIKTKTNLLLGFWITPAKRGDPIDDLIKNEMSALEKGFKEHGQTLSDLVIGLSVGSEDIYRWNQTNESGVAATDVISAIKKVKESIGKSSFAEYMKGKPIGHVDTAKWAVVEGADFYGMTAYPYWEKKHISEAKESFHSSLEEVKKRAGNTPVWIAEMGWPFEGASQGEAVASAENLQTFWNEVGCSILGTHNTFWYELLRDSEGNQPDWGILDSVTYQPRMKDTSCGKSLNSSASVTLPASSRLRQSVSSSEELKSTSLMDKPTLSTSAAMSASSEESSLETPLIPPDSTELHLTTTHVTTTVTVTIQPSSAPEDADPTTDDDVDYEGTITQTKTTTVISTIHLKRPTPSTPARSPASVTQTPESSMAPSSVPWCVTFADVDHNGQYLPIAGNTAGPDGECTPPPAFTGLPYETNQPSSTTPPIGLFEETPTTEDSSDEEYNLPTPSSEPNSLDFPTILSSSKGAVIPSVLSSLISNIASKLPLSSNPPQASPLPTPSASSPASQLTGRLLL